MEKDFFKILWNMMSVYSLTGQHLQVLWMLYW